jgi:hypothetical protein
MRFEDEEKDLYFLFILVGGGGILNNRCRQPYILQFGDTAGSDFYSQKGREGESKSQVAAEITTKPINTMEPAA